MVGETTVLMVGGGGREHALGWNIAKSPRVRRILYAPGNPRAGTEEKSENFLVDGKPLNGADPKNFSKLADVIEAEDVGMVVVGPEAPLAGGEDGSHEGLVDFLAARGYHNIVGCTKEAAALEASKFFSQDVMREANIPQADSILCETTDLARGAIERMSTPEGVVIKAEGLTGGKGVSVCDSREQALAEIGRHAELYGPKVLISQRLFGLEVSVLGLSDGDRVWPFEMVCQDHKPLLDGDFGPNTGGMGAYCPVPFVSPTFAREIADSMMTPAVQEMKKRGLEYRGVLYAGLKLTDSGPKVLEFNIRFGDPENQPLMMMIKSGLFDALYSIAKGEKLKRLGVEYNDGAACCVTMASNGYPGVYDKGLIIDGIEEAEEQVPHTKVFHAGTALKEDGQLVTSGGRVLGVTKYSVVGIDMAQKGAYQAVEIINRYTARRNNRLVFINRCDIGDKARAV